MIKPRNIYLLTLPRVHLLDLAAPAQIFAHEAFFDEVTVRYIAPESSIQSHQGLQLAELSALPETIAPNDWLLIIGSGQLYQHLNEPASQLAIQWLQKISQNCKLIAGICSGTLLAAQAGILDGKRCTTHHNLIPHLRTLAPKANVQEDCIFVEDDGIWTSAGITTRTLWF